MIDLVSKRWAFIFVSLLIIVPGIIAVLLGGLKPGIDFTGGTRWEVLPKTTQAGNTETFKSVLAAHGFPDVQVKKASITRGSLITDTVVLDLPGQLNVQEKSDFSKVLIENNLVAGREVSTTVSLTETSGTAAGTPAPTSAATAAVTSTTSVSGTTSISGTSTLTATGTTTGTTGTTGSSPLSRELKVWQIDSSALIQSYEVGPTIGSELIQRAFIAIGAVSLVILIYLTIVFNKVPNAFRYGVCAIIALLHDVLVVLGVFAILGLLFGIEIDALFVTAMLTVIGFSVHDTIVVFDRVRENIVKRRFERFEETVNYSLVQTLARSINTSVTVLLTLLALYLFGGQSIKTFVLALLIGIASGTYSSIFNASMMLVIWENGEWRRPSLSPRPPAQPETRRAAAR
jgi:preprotein translocase SecF subunit